MDVRDTMTAQETLSELVRKEVAASGISQSFIASELGISLALTGMVLAGTRTLHLPRAERILALCGAKLRFSVVDFDEETP